MRLYPIVCNCFGYKLNVEARDIAKVYVVRNAFEVKDLRGGFLDRFDFMWFKFQVKLTRLGVVC